MSVGGCAVSRHAVRLRPNDVEAHRFMGDTGTDGGGSGIRGSTLRCDEWWEVEMGRLLTVTDEEDVVGKEVAVSFEVLGWYPKRGLIVKGIEFRPLM